MSAALPQDLELKLRAAWERRAPLRARPGLDAWRLVSSGADGVPDVTVDHFAGVLIASLYRELAASEEAQLGSALASLPGVRSVYLKRRPREARVLAGTQKDALAPELPLAGEALESVVVLEDGRRQCIRPAQGLSVGLYLDMREARGWVQRHARGLSVLNLFAYTCAFSVAARLGGAARVLNVDASRKVLDWGEQNHRENGLAVERRDFLAGDCFEWLERLAKKGESFSLVILDPPSFATTRSSRFSAERDYPKLAAAAARVVSPDGQLLACCNLAQLTGARFEAKVLEGCRAAGRTAELQAGAQPELEPSTLDFPRERGDEAALKLRLLTLR